MKVGIITKHAIRNYGSFAQAYGLLRTLQDLGYDSELIDYAYPNPYHPTYPSKKRRMIHFFHLLVKNLIGLKGWLFEKRYRECFSRYYRTSSHYPTPDSLFRNPPLYDVYISGSDQIWRPEFTHGDPVFFADFAPSGARRISYASSFGCVRIGKKYRENYQVLLSKFSAISVREQSAVALVHQLTGREAQLVLDPSLLVSAACWKQMARVPKIKGKYVVCYGSRCKSFVERLAHSFAKARGYRVVRISSSILDQLHLGVYSVIDAGPLEWLGLLSGAEMIFVGGSFHGTAFAIQFQKPFISVLSGDEHHDTRQKSLLQTLGLSQLGVYEGKVAIPDLEKRLSQISWTDCSLRLEQMRNESLEWLRKHLCPLSEDGKNAE